MALTDTEAAAFARPVSLALQDKYDQLAMTDEWSRFVKDVPAVDDVVVNNLFFEQVIPSFFLAIGEPPPQINLAGLDYPIQLVKRAVTVAINEIAANRDTVGNELRERAQSVAAGVQHYKHDDMVFALNNGETAQVLAPDKVPLFSDSHENFGQPYDNLRVGVLDQANLLAAFAAMRKFPSNVAGRTLNIKGNVLTVPSVLEGFANVLLNSTLTTVLTGSGDNPVKSLASRAVVLTSGDLVDDNDWFLFSDDQLPGRKSWVHVKHKDFFPMNLEFLKGDFHNQPDTLLWMGKVISKTVNTHAYNFIKFKNA